MSRRDTIIIAVLVNAGLLMILFATAMRSDGKKKEPSMKLAQVEEVMPHTSTPVEFELEEDLLDQYLVEAPPPQKPVIIPEVVVKESAVVAAEKPPENAVQITVKKGDFLERIAKSNHTTVAAIMQMNRLTSSQLKVGQVLQVPVGERAEVLPARIREEFYIVKDGDSPWKIASKNQIKLEELLRINDLDEHKARRLRPGDRLKIR